ncbi:hypothetical protein HF086_013889 [Spodoptera exigua]|uniref:HTH psq-type domain-containing protein n=1 Tax=Spodoptera exigua TaxID=7107 RepID=A0A922MI23_SPOEX|nr:hypothetical protein HF086_013889 [Spodoptera exigua]
MPPIKGKIISYSEDYMVKAYNEVKSGISISAAAKKYNIPYSTLSYKVHESRAAVTNEALSNWFSEISEFFKEKSLESVTRNPKRVFNCDETAFFLNPKVRREGANGGHHEADPHGNEKAPPPTLGVGYVAPWIRHYNWT